MRALQTSHTREIQNDDEEILSTFVGEVKLSCPSMSFIKSWFIYFSISCVRYFCNTGSSFSGPVIFYSGVSSAVLIYDLTAMSWWTGRDEREREAVPQTRGHSLRTLIWELWMVGWVKPWRPRPSGPLVSQQRFVDRMHWYAWHCSLNTPNYNAAA